MRWNLVDPSPILSKASEIHGKLSPSPTEAYPQQLYLALLSSLAKAFLLQAETEITAKKDTAFPLARLILKIINLGHPMLAEAFMARMVGRTGGWSIGAVVTREQASIPSACRDLVTRFTNALRTSRVSPTRSSEKRTDTTRMTMRRTSTTDLSESSHFTLQFFKLPRDLHDQCSVKHPKSLSRLTASNSLASGPSLPELRPLPP